MKRKKGEQAKPGRFVIKLTTKGDKRRMPKKITKRQLQVPFREKGLLTVDAFIRYCDEYGIKTDRAELEYFEEEALLLPAVRVYLGVVPYKRVLADFKGDGQEEWRYIFKNSLSTIKKKFRVKKVDRRTYYSYGALSMGGEAWFASYKKRGMVAYPARRKFRPWKDYDVKEHDYTTNWRQLENAAEALYSRLQMYLLPLIHNQRRLLLKNDALFGPEEEWVRRGERVRGIFDKERTAEPLRRIVWRHNKFFGLLVDIENLWDRHCRDLDQQICKEVREEVEEGRGDPEEIAADVLKEWRHQRTPLDEYLTDDAEALLRKHGFSRKEVESWRFAFLGYGTLILKRPLVKKYLMKLDDADLMASEDPYRLYGLINWFIRLCGGRYLGIKEAIMRFPGRFCPYCGGPIPKPKRNQVSCGREECKREHKLKLQRDGYRSGKYS